RSAIGNRFLYHGQYFDYDTGLLYLRSRFYDPYLGQFLQRDPLGYADSVNLYAGFGHNPTSLRDPTGMAPPRQRSPNGGSAHIVRDEMTPKLKTVGTRPRPIDSPRGNSVPRSRPSPHERSATIDVTDRRHGRSGLAHNVDGVAPPEEVHVRAP